MAIEKIQVIYCDVHQERGERVEGEHVKITLDSDSVKIDLCPDCKVEYLSGVQELFDLIRKPAARKKKPAAAASKKKGPDPAAVRTWAEENGYEVNPRGRVPADILAAYAAAH